MDRRLFVLVAVSFFCLPVAAAENADEMKGSAFALSVAVLRGYKDVVRLLLDAGADVQRDKKDLMELAKDKPEIKAMLRQALRKK